MNDLIPVNYDGDQPTVSGRDLHKFLEVATAYKDWFPRMCEYGFTEGADFSSNLSESTGGRPATDHRLSIPMGKELSMLQRTERGKLARQHFIRIEEAWNKPEAVMARALRMADDTIHNLTGSVKALQAENSQLVVDKQIMAPKAAYFDTLVDNNVLTGIRETVKELKVREKEFVNLLIDRKYLYRDQKGKLQPYADKLQAGLFEVKEKTNTKNGWGGTQTLVTPKGRELFLELTLGM